MASGKVSAAVPLVAVCVCTRARPWMLRRCLASLRAQQLDAARLTMRLVVVDNNPEPSALPIYEEVCRGGQWPGELVHCPRPGIPIARNAALDAALACGADYIAFLDDDEVAPPHWLSGLVRAMADCRADAVQGGVRNLPAGVDDAGVLAAMAACAQPPVGRLTAEPAES